MAILDPHVQIKLAKMFSLMWDDYIDSPTEELEAYIDSTELTEEFTATQEDIDKDGLVETEVGDLLRRLNKDGEAVIALADEASKQASESKE